MKPGSLLPAVFLEQLQTLNRGAELHCARYVLYRVAVGTRGPRAFQRLLIAVGIDHPDRAPVSGPAEAEDVHFDARPGYAAAAGPSRAHSSLAMLTITCRPRSSLAYNKKLAPEQQDGQNL